MADYLLQEGGTATGRLLLELGGLALLESGGGDILLEATSLSTTERFTLEDGSGFVLLEAGVPPPTPTGVQGGIIIPRRQHFLSRELRSQLDEDEAIALSLLLRTRRRPGRPR